MIAVIQCAGSKRDGGYFITPDGLRVKFVAHPELAPCADDLYYTRPDDRSPSGATWRQILTSYNTARDNPWKLHTAANLYEPQAYRQLQAKLGPEQVFVLSAGWGLVRSDFLLPQYDITFSSAVKKPAPWKFRNREDHYEDFSHIPQDCTDHVHFFGGKDYVALFCRLTSDVAGRRTIYFNSSAAPRAPGCELMPFKANRNMNWHYDCVTWFLSQGEELDTA
jgi:hypothetical protein